MHTTPSFAFPPQWRRFLFDRPIEATWVEALPTLLKRESHEFLDRVAATPDRRSRIEIDRWYASREGQESLSSFVRRVWHQMASYSRHAMAAHDARHAMFKVPAAALEFMAAEGAEGWERLGLLSSLLHDHGRWAEERIWGGPGQSLVHARLSFVLCAELMTELDAPQVAKDQILLGVLQHTSGAAPHDSMPLKLTVAADREQLSGAEIVLRILHHPVNAAGQLAFFHDACGGESVLDRLGRYVLSGIRGPLFSRPDQTRSLADTLLNVLLMAEEEAASQRRFLGYGAGPLDRSRHPEGFRWEQSWQQARHLRPPVEDARVAATRLLTAPNVARGALSSQDALRKLNGSTAEQMVSIAGALAYADLKRRAEDVRQFDRIGRIAVANASDSVVVTLAELLKSGWDHHET